MRENKLYGIWWTAPAFGDHLLAAYVANILNFNDIPCVLKTPPRIKKLVNCEDFYPAISESMKQYLGRWEPFTDFSQELSRMGLIPIMLQRTPDQKERVFAFLENFIKMAALDVPLSSLNIKDVPDPIKYAPLPDIEKYDVCLVTETGPHTVLKDWPYFPELKSLFKKAHISYIDLSSRGIKNLEFLNHIKKCKVYLGIDSTGATHYAAPFIKGKGIVIKSGYCDFRFAGTPYDYEKIENPVECAPCFKRKDCEYNYKCMAEISPQTVFKIITDKLSSSSDKP